MLAHSEALGVEYGVPLHILLLLYISNERISAINITHKAYKETKVLKLE
jgi:hypothetical protein